MTNPDNAVGTNAAYGGRTSVNAFNDDLGAYSRGILSGWACEPSSGLTVALGGAADTRDVAVAEDAGGNKTTINNINASPIEVTIGAAPASNTRIDAIVAYVDASPQGSATITDNYEACGLITVQGTASSTPVAPNESAIRAAITADGASGATAYYVVLAYISIVNGTTDITSANITAGDAAQLASDSLPKIPADKLPKITASMIDFSTLSGNYSTSEQDTGFTWINGKHIYKKTLYWDSLPNNTEVQSGSLGITNVYAIKIEGAATAGTGVLFLNMYRPQSPGGSWSVRIDNSTGLAYVGTGGDYRAYKGYATIYYTKSS